VGGNADEIGQCLEGIQAEVMMNRDWPELSCDFRGSCVRALARVVGSSSRVALISDAIVDYPGTWIGHVSKHAWSVPKKNQLSFHATKFCYTDKEKVTSAMDMRTREVQ
jgi:hypothetical protein